MEALRSLVIVCEPESAFSGDGCSGVFALLLTLGACSSFRMRRLVSGSGWVILFRHLLFEDGVDVDDALCEALAHRCCIHQKLEYTYSAAVLNIGSARSSELRYFFQPY